MTRRRLAPLLAAVAVLAPRGAHAAVDVRADLWSESETLTAMAGGGIDLAAIDPACRGFSTAGATARVVVAQGPRRVTFVAWSDGGTGLAVRDASGRLHCAAPDTEATVTLAVASGPFEVFGAAEARGVRHPFILAIFDAAHRWPVSRREAIAQRGVAELPRSLAPPASLDPIFYRWNTELEPGARLSASAMPAPLLARGMIAARAASGLSCAELTGGRPLVEVSLTTAIARVDVSAPGAMLGIRVTRAGGAPDMVACADTAGGRATIEVPPGDRLAIYLAADAPPAPYLLRMEPVCADDRRACALAAISRDLDEVEPPVLMSGEAADEVDGAAVGCAGRFPASPQHRITRTARRPIARLAIHARRDVPVLVRAPGGALTCAPPSKEVTVDTTIDGTYEIFVGATDDILASYVLEVVLPGGSPDRARALAQRMGRDQRSEVDAWFADRIASYEHPWGPGDVTSYLTDGFPAILAAREGARRAPRREVQGVRVRLLEAVVRLSAPGGERCTATHVLRDGHAGLLTAAHCLYRRRGDRLAGRHARVSLPDGTSVPTAGAVMVRAFERCARGGGRYRDCLARGADVAFIPFTGRRRAGPLWDVAACREREVSIFGYGLDGGSLPRDLQVGAFHIDSGAASGIAIATSRLRQWVAAGDSGGPVIGAADDSLLARRQPAVCFVVAAVQHRAGQSARSLLAPVTALGDAR